jgi:hypothetical protein
LLERLADGIHNICRPIAIADNGKDPGARALSSTRGDWSAV